MCANLACGSVSLLFFAFAFLFVFLLDFCWIFPFPPLTFSCLCAGRKLKSLQKHLDRARGVYVEDEEDKMEWGKGLVQDREKEKAKLEAQKNSDKVSSQTTRVCCFAFFFLVYAVEFASPVAFGCWVPNVFSLTVVTYAAIRAHS